MGGCKTAIQGMLQAMRELKHYIRTGFGDSDTPYDHEEEAAPPQGLGQGSGTALPGWSSITAVLRDVMKQLGFGYGHTL